VSIGVNHGDFKTVHKANGIDPKFAIVETLIDPFNSWPLENPLRILESNSVPRDVPAVFFFVPTRVHSVY
ncbi:MAG TPA: hypothetical protein VKD04_08720, partial [Burkholderiales bacterium]|nr:hypothetical protein [Burkholderiales bacterium]